MLLTNNAIGQIPGPVVITGQVASDKPLIIKGAVSQSGDLQQWQNSNAAVLAKVDSAGVITSASSIVSPNISASNYFTDSASLCPYISVQTTHQLTHIARVATDIPIVSKGAASQTADLLQAQNSASAVQFAITNRGSGGSPIWAFKVRAVANAESMAQAHVIGAATGKAIEVMDDVGASLGWIPLYA